MTLREKQQAFAWMVSKLINEAIDRGYGVTLGEAWRSPQEANRLAKAGKGIKRSLHCDRLAIDLNLFDSVAPTAWRNERYLTRTEDYSTLGDWWEAQSTDELTFAWGGRFGDGNHFSLSHGGRR